MGSVKMFLDNFYESIFIYIRPFLKWFLHRFTRLCELQRICYGAPEGSVRTKKVEYSLIHTRHTIMKLPDEVPLYRFNDEIEYFAEKLVCAVMFTKKIKRQLHPDFERLLTDCLFNIFEYKWLCQTVESQRTTAYDSDNPEHEQTLLELWDLLMPYKLDSRVSKDWQKIGFQGDDPKTDFRGMGVLGLENLHYFAREYNSAAKHSLLHSHHPNHGYIFAIVGINLTSLACKLLKSGVAKTHFYNLRKKATIRWKPNRRRKLDINVFHKFYSFLFFEFDRFWMESKPKSIMDFPIIYEKFDKNIIKLLQDDSTVFKMNLAVENI